MTENRCTKPLEMVHFAHLAGQGYEPLEVYKVHKVLRVLKPNTGKTFSALTISREAFFTKTREGLYTFYDFYPSHHNRGLRTTESEPHRGRRRLIFSSVTSSHEIRRII